MTNPTTPRERRREQIFVRGMVQGVGFRPFIYRLATAIGLDGWVKNSPQGVAIEAEGESAMLDEFLRRIPPESPPLSSIRSLEHTRLDPVGLDSFEIRPSARDGVPDSPVLPDIATCPDCLREISDPSERRYRYPFTNCTNCGPRFSIILSLPYDRTRTTMKEFTMCPGCRREYDDPADRRFHAQPIACPVCGPQLRLLGARGELLADRDDALLAAAAAVASGKIVAVKGLGGFHLVADAANDGSVGELRRRKGREEKPFALMYPSLDALRRDCEIPVAGERLLVSPQAPIVLLKRLGRDQVRPAAGGIAHSVAPGNPYLGAMLPCTPLHHLLLSELEFPVVATSGNLSDEPICTDEREALRRLRGIADLFLVHDRPIRRHVDDSVARIIAGRAMLIRRARGYAPSPLVVGTASPGDRSRTFLAVGAHLKNTVAIGSGSGICVSQHIGDLGTEESVRAFRDTIGSFRELYDSPHDVVVCDMHPGYASTQYARDDGAPVIGVQHHHAHVCSCMADNDLTGSVLGVSWDGTGYGPDGSVWGGEFLLTDGAAFRRVAALRTFPLPGGDNAVREPGRSALGMLWCLWGDALFEREDLFPVRDRPVHERDILRRMLGRRLNSPMTSSAGRLFDAVAALLGLRQRSSFEGQAAMELEFIAGDPDAPSDGGLYPFDVVDGAKGGAGARFAPGLVVDWGPMIGAIVDDLAAGVGPGPISGKFHDTLAEIVIDVARRVGNDRVLLTGGCFQNRYLAERTIARLMESRFTPYWHRNIPPNDGGIAAGQVLCAVLQEGDPDVSRHPG